MYVKYYIGDKSITVTYGENKIEMMTNILFSRNKLKTNAFRSNNETFILFNKFLEWKGPEFNKVLWENLNIAYDAIVYPSLEDDSMNLNRSKKYIHNILDLLNTDDLKNFIVNKERMTMPADLLDSFDKEIEKSKLGTRTQTYTKDDYLELLTLSLGGKIVLPLLGQYVERYITLIPGNAKDFIPFNLVKSHPFFKDSPAYVKLHGLIEKVIESRKSDEIDKIRVIEKQITYDDLPDYITAGAFIQRVFLAPIIDDRSDKHIVTNVYHYVINKLKNTTDVKKAIKIKEMRTSNTDDSEESVIEIYRMLSDVPEGFKAEANWIANNLDHLVKSMNVPIEKSILDRASIFSRELLNKHIPKEAVYITSIVFKNVLHPASFKFLKKEAIINMMTVAFAYMWSVGLDRLAITYMSYVNIDIDSDIMSINNTTKGRLPSSIKDLLDKYFPYKRVVWNGPNKATKEFNIIEEAITEYVNAISSYELISVVDNDLILSIYDSRHEANKIPSDLNIMLAKLFLIIEDHTLLKELDKLVLL